MEYSWFDEFVRATVRVWRESRPRLNPSKTAELYEDLTAGEKGRFGESDVGLRLESAGYLVAFSPGSKSPGDVWGIRQVDKFLHIPIVQVKATIGEHPATLTKREQRELLELTGVAFDQFKCSGLVPRRLKRKRLIVSSGYAGILIRPSIRYPLTHIRTTLHSHYLRGYTHDLELTPKEQKQNIEDIHVFSSSSRKYIRWELGSL